jgi:hypothetical protein
MPENYSPIHGQKGEFRISLNLSEYESQAWQLLKFCEQFGFNNIQFRTNVRQSGAVEIWVILLQEFHSFTASADYVVSAWEAQIDTIRDLLGVDNHLNFYVLLNFAEYLEPAIA